MYKELIQDKLRSMGIPYIIRGIEIQCACLNPLHKDQHPSFSINSKTSAYYCFSCGYKGSFKKYLGDDLDPDLERTAMYLQSLQDLEEVDDDTQVVIHLPPNADYTIPSSGIRGISKRLLDSLGVYYCHMGRYRGRLIFPVVDVAGEISGFDARIFSFPGKPTIEPTFPQAKYLRPSAMKTTRVLYGAQAIDYAGTIVLTEGVFDALSWLELGVPAVCNFGLQEATPNKAGIILSLGASKIANGFDKDAAGIAGWQNIKDSWRKYLEISKPIPEMAEFMLSPFTDVNDYLIDKEKDEDIHNCGLQADGLQRELPEERADTEYFD